MAFPTDNMLPGTDSEGVNSDANVKYHILNRMLNKQPIRDDFGIGSCITEVERYTGYQQILDLDYARKETLSQDWPADLQKWIYDIESGIQNGIGIDFGIQKTAYNDTLSGKELTVANFIEQIFRGYFMRIAVIDKPFPGIENVEKDEIFIATVKDAIKSMAEGVAFAIKVSAWKKELQKLDPMNENQEFVKDESRFKNAGQKYFLLYELGIMDFIEEKYPSLTASKKALLIAFITNSKNSKSFENIFTNLRNPHHDHYPFNETNETYIINILSKLGIKKSINPFKIKRDKK